MKGAGSVYHLSPRGRIARQDFLIGESGWQETLEAVGLTRSRSEAEIVRNEWEEFEVMLGDVLHKGDDLEVEMSVYSATEDSRICKRAAFAEPDATLEATGVPR